MPTATTDDDRAMARQKRVERAAAAAEALRSSEGWQRWLATRRRFRTYSLRNQLIIAVELPDAQRVAGFRKWLSLGYCVRKGEKAAYIWAPMPPSKKRIAEWEASGKHGPKPQTRFGLAPVFGDHQVEPLEGVEQAPLVPPVAWGHVSAEGTVDAEALLCELDARLCHPLAITLVLGPAEPGRRGRGFYSPSENLIWLDAAQPQLDQAATFIHELCHALVRLERQDSDPQLDYATEELVVESASYAVCSAIGLDADASTIPYLASWAKESTATDAILAHATLINRLAARIEDALATDAQEPTDG
jgi:antirestriction protein ArdC